MKLIIFIHFLSLRERKFICIVSLLSHSLRCLSLRAVLILAPVYFGSIYSNWMDPHTPYVILQKTSGSNRSCSGYQVLMPTLSTPMFILIPLEMVERHWALPWCTGWVSGKGLIAKEIPPKHMYWPETWKTTVRWEPCSATLADFLLEARSWIQGVFCIHIPTFSLKPCGYQEATVAERAAGLQV